MAGSGPAPAFTPVGIPKDALAATEMLASEAIFLQLADHCRVGYEYPKKRLPHMPIVRTQWKTFGFRTDEAFVPNLR